jgi:hypothetical protein
VQRQPVNDRAGSGYVQFLELGEHQVDQPQTPIVGAIGIGRFRLSSSQTLREVDPGPAGVSTCGFPRAASRTCRATFPSNGRSTDEILNPFAGRGLLWDPFSCSPAVAA